MPNAENPKLSAAEAAVEEADALRVAGRYEEAIARYDELVLELGGEDNESVDGVVRMALAKKGSVLVQLDRFAEADEAFDALCARTAGAQEPTLALLRAHAAVAAILARRVRVLVDAGNWEQVVLATGALLKRFRGEPNELYAVPDALESRADALGGLGRRQEAIAVYDDLIEGYASSADDPLLRNKVAYALAAKAELLYEHERYVETIDVIDELVTRFGQASEFEMQLRISHALLKKALVLGSLERWYSAIAVEDDLIEQYAHSASLELREDAARALSLKALALRALGEVDLAIAVWIELAELQPGDSPAIRDLAAYGLAQRAELLSMTGRYAEAIVLSDAQIEASSGVHASEQLRHDSLQTKSVALIGEERYAEAIAILDEYIWRSEEAPSLRSHIASALGSKAEALRRLGRQDEAMLVLSALIERFQDDADSQSLVSHAREAHDEMLRGE